MRSLYFQRRDLDFQFSRTTVVSPNGSISLRVLRPLNEQSLKMQDEKKKIVKWIIRCNVENSHLYFHISVLRPMNTGHGINSTIDSLLILDLEHVLKPLKEYPNLYGIGSYLVFYSIFKKSIPFSNTNRSAVSQEINYTKNKVGGGNHCIILIDAERTFDKTQDSCLIKTLKYHWTGKKLDKNNKKLSLNIKRKYIKR